MLKANFNSFNESNDSRKSSEEKKTLESFMSNQFKKVTIDQPFEIFNEEVLKKKTDPNYEEYHVDYGILELLDGDWYSYIEANSKRVSNIKDNEFKENFGSGVHTTIMPSPGTTQNNIPGKFSFECDEYIEKLSFDLVPGGIRNRGGANEQFCGAVKYEQSIIGIVVDKLAEKFLFALQVGYINQKISLFNQKVDNVNKEITIYNKENKNEKLIEICSLQHVKDYLTLKVSDFNKELNDLKVDEYTFKTINDKLEIESKKIDENINKIKIDQPKFNINGLLNDLKDLCVSLSRLFKVPVDLLEKLNEESITDDKYKDLKNSLLSEDQASEILGNFLISYKKKYQSIHEENGMYLWLSDLYKNPATEDSIKKDRGVHNWDNEKGKAVLFKKLYGTDEKIDILQKELNNLLDKNPIKNLNKLKGFIDISIKKDIKKIEKILDECKSFDELIEILGINKLLIDIGDLNICKEILIILIKLCILSYYRPIQINELSEIVKAHPFLDATLYNVGSLFIPNYVTEKPQNLKTIKSIVPAKELQPGEGIDRPTFVPDYSISRSGVIPHGSTITLLGDLQKEAGSFLINGEPMFVNPTVGTWDYDHMAVSPTMGGATSPSDDKRPFDLYNPPLSFTPTQDMNAVNDEGENLVYTQQLFLHNLYPYSVRPDLRLRDAIKNQNVKNHIKITMFSEKDEGAQGGIVNIPFVNRFVPTVNMKMNMWLETVVEDNKEILQLQYEQIVFFEFGFGDGGGTTSWPHIQVNTLRQYKDLNKHSQDLAHKQFIEPAQEALRKKVAKNEELKIAEAVKCPFGHTSKNS